MKKVVFLDGPLDGQVIPARPGRHSFYLDASGHPIPLPQGDKRFVRRSAKGYGEGLYVKGSEVVDLDYPHLAYRWVPKV